MNIPQQNQTNTKIQIFPLNTRDVLQTQADNDSQFPQSNIFSQIHQQVTIEIGNHQYIKEKCIGKGTFGVVYLLIQKETKQQYALKIQNQVTQSESDILNKLKQKKFKNLVNTIEFQKNQNSNEYFILMEYCQLSLQDVIDKKLIDPKESRYIIKQIANGIKELHENNIIHRDLKPENILVFEMKDGQTGKIQKIYKICDFGLSSQKEYSQTYKCGTSHYMAPEQIQQMKTNLKHQGYDKSVDIWALGAVIFEIFTGQVLFIAYSKEEIYNIILEISQDQLNKKISNILKVKHCDLIINMMQKNPEKRIKIDDVLKKLSENNNKAVKKKPNRSYTDQQFQLNLLSNNPYIQHPLISPRSQNKPNNQQQQQQSFINQQDNQQSNNPFNQKNNQFPNQQNQFNIDNQGQQQQFIGAQNFQLNQEQSRQLEQQQISNQSQIVHQISKQNEQQFQQNFEQSIPQNQQFSKQPYIHIPQQLNQFPQHQNQFHKQFKEINQEQNDIQNQQITSKINQNLFQQQNLINPSQNNIINQQNQQQQNFQKQNFQQFQNPVQNPNAFQQTQNNQQQLSAQKNKQIQQL